MLTFCAEVPIRWSDMDAFGHVNHARMVTLLEEARIQFLFAQGIPTANLLASGCVIADVNIKYKAQIRHDDSPLCVTMWIENLRTSDFVVHYQARSSAVGVETRPAIVASTRMVSFNLVGQHVQRLTDLEREYLAQYEHVTGA